MKKGLKNVSLAAALGAMALTATACSSDSADYDYEIGITQIVSHPSLDLAVQGFKDVLKEAGLNIKYDENNAQGEGSNISSIAGKLKDNQNLDLILGVATPTAQAVVSAITDVPIIFSAVTDPVSAELVPSFEASGTNVTGVSDLNPDARPAELVQSLVPDVKTIGVLYSSAEVNSEVQVNALEEEATALGIEVKRSPITNSSEVAIGAQALIGVDAIYVPTDNTVVASLEALIDFANTNKIPVFSADYDSVARGTVASRGVDYYELGRKTGEMALQILKDGVDPGTIPTLIVRETKVIYNEDAATKQGLTLTEEFKQTGSPVAAE